jgi:hypothetical protein
MGWNLLQPEFAASKFAEPVEGEQTSETVGLRYVGSEVAHARLMSVIWKTRL